ncbi:MAG: DUF929 family protein [Solirubrobacteraceae bacterium]
MTRTLLALSVAVLAALPAAASARPDGSKPITPGVYSALTTVPQTTLDAVGVSKLSDPAQFTRMRLDGPALTRAGKPLVLSANLSWCPHCAANSWALGLALERFGSFTKLRTVDTGRFYSREAGGPKSMDNTKGLSFWHARYTSDYVAFTPVVLQDRRGRKVQTLTKAQTAALKFAGGGLPAVSFGGAIGTVGSGYGPEFLGGASSTPLEIAQAMHRPDDPIGRRVDSLANFFTAAICELTAGRPADVCTAGGTVAGQSELPK